MPETERFEDAPKQVDFHNLVATKILNLGLVRGFPPYKLSLDAKTEKQRKDGTKLRHITPFLLGTATQKDLKSGSNSIFLLHNPHDKTEKYSYLVRMGDRTYGDGETTDHIVISRVPSPHKFQNKREWVVESVDGSLNPWTDQHEFQTEEEVRFPTILISMTSGPLLIGKTAASIYLISEIN